MSKKIRVGNELLLLNILVVLLILIIAISPSNVLRIILGLPFVLFLPGYALVSALYPKKGDPGGMERVALGFGLSIALTIALGFILSYTPWGLSPSPLLLTLTFFILANSAIAYYRRRSLAAEQRFALSLQVALPRWVGLSNLDRALSIVLVVSVLAAIGLLAYVVAAPKFGERFTEFYVLGDRPEQLAPGEEATVTLGITNHEGQETSYRIEMRIDGVKNGEVGPLILADEEKWEQEVSFVPDEADDDKMV
ncbi:MAG: DUF1616 domain-containing protein [Dehalococcoidia bacterium]